MSDERTRNLEAATARGEPGAAEALARARCRVEGHQLDRAVTIHFEGNRAVKQSSWRRRASATATPPPAPVRELAAHPTPAARDRLEAERLRRGDRTWLPVRVADLNRWERGTAALRVFCTVAGALGLSLDGAFDLWASWAGPQPHRPSYWTEEMHRIAAGTLLYQTADGRVRPCEPGEVPIGVATASGVERSGVYEIRVPGEGEPVSLAEPRRRRYPRRRRR